MRTKNTSAINTHKSHFANLAKPLQILSISRAPSEQSYPTHYPQLEEAPFTLGSAMGIDDVARILGCSPWTVRQRYLPQGLPHVRASARGKLVFFREQVVGWILKRQQQQT